MSAPDRIVTNKSGTMIITPPAIPLHETDIEWVRTDLCDPLQDARVQALVAAARKVNQSYWHESDVIIIGIYELETALRALEQGEG